MTTGLIACSACTQLGDTAAAVPKSAPCCSSECCGWAADLQHMQTCEARPGRPPATHARHGRTRSIHTTPRTHAHTLWGDRLYLDVLRERGIKAHAPGPVGAIRETAHVRADVRAAPVNADQTDELRRGEALR